MAFGRAKGQPPQLGNDIILISIHNARFFNLLRPSAPRLSFRVGFLTQAHLLLTFSAPPIVANRLRFLTFPRPLALFARPSAGLYHTRGGLGFCAPPASWRSSPSMMAAPPCTDFPTR